MAAARWNRIHVVLLAMAATVLLQLGLGATFDSARLAAGYYGAFHGLWFALFTWLALLILEQRFAAFNVGLWIAGVWLTMLVLATLTALAQVLVEQPLGFRDVALSMLGVSAVLAIWASHRGLMPRRPAGVAALALLATSTLPWWQANAMQSYRNGLMPDLIRVDDARALTLMRTNSALQRVDAPAEWHDLDVASVLAVTFADTELPGVGFPEPVPDWRGYATLVLLLFQPGGRRPLLLNVIVTLKDGAARPVSKTYELGTGAHRLELHLADHPEIHQAGVAHILLQTNEDFRDRRLLIGALRLE